MQEGSQLLTAVIGVISEIGGLADLQPDQDFYDAGLTSVQALPLLLELEARLDVTIPDDQFMAARTARGLSDVVRGIREA
jgi:acyl carrier protein